MWDSSLRNVNRSRPDMVLDKGGRVEVFCSVYGLFFSWLVLEISVTAY